MAIYKNTPSREHVTFWSRSRKSGYRAGKCTGMRDHITRARISELHAENSTVMRDHVRVVESFFIQV